MKHKTRLAVLVTLSMLLVQVVYADRYVTVTPAASIDIPEGETALVVSAAPYLPYSQFPLYYISGGLTNSMYIYPPGDNSYPRLAPTSENPLPLVGPATISTEAGILGMKIVNTIYSTTVSASAEGTPSNAVVIPEDATGPVEIILESSTDLISWNSATPGTYGSSDSNRFFRVRAVAQ